MSDPVAGEGPLRGILTALENASTDIVIVLPVDMPNITPAPLAWLAARLREHPTAAAVMVKQHGHAADRIEPLPAAFRKTTAQALSAQLGDRRLALHQLTESSEVVVVSVSSDWPGDFWVNLNTPSDLATYQRLASGGGSD